MKNDKLADLGEFGFISRIAAMTRTGTGVVTGIEVKEGRFPYLFNMVSLWGYPPMSDFQPLSAKTGDVQK